ncbi:CHC2 zinc finger domain-containing protein [Sellimonas caecigallum]|uniref:CHC2 zinc finger domain-containing protein n=1 Tax=Sellimonas caecigallum TaxID=2592333 RepID=UPI002ED3A4FA
MDVFEVVKKNVTVRQAAEFYGFKPNRSGLIRCIFHNDRTPSMKVDRRYYCFGCGCTGDVIDFTARLFGLTPKEAALKLADDFGIPYGSREKPPKARKISSLARNDIPKADWETECVRYVKLFLDYRALLFDWKNRYVPKTKEEEWDGHFVTALKELSVVEYYLDILLFGDEWEKKGLIQDKRKAVERIERECRKNFRYGKAECPTENGTDGADRSCREHKRTAGGHKTGNDQGNDAELYHCIKRRSASQRESSI